MAIANREQFFTDFPNLNRRNFRIASEPTSQYNCVAFVVGDRHHQWWPIEGHWPCTCRREDSVAAFIEMFQAYGYESCADGVFEPGYEKIAIYAKEDEPQHVAKQPTGRNGRWKSKIGTNVDIEHELSAIEGPCYGRVVHIMRRPRAMRRPRIVASGHP